MMRAVKDFFLRAGAYLNFTLAFVFIAGLVFTVCFGVCLYMMRQEVIDNVEGRVKSDAYYVQNYVEGKLQCVEEVAFTALCTHFHSSIQKSPDGGHIVCIDTDTPLPSEEALFRFLEQLLETNSMICGAAIGFEPGIHEPQGAYGFAAYVTNVSGKNQHLRLGNIHDYRKKPWYKGPADSRKPLWSAPFRETSQGKVVCCYSYPIHDRKGNFIGAIAFDIDTAPIREMCKEVTPYPQSKVTITDRNFNYVSHPDTALLLHNVEEDGFEYDALLVDSILFNPYRQKRGSFIKGQAPELGLYFYFCPIDRASWIITTVCPKEDIFGRCTRIERTTALIALVGILFMALCLLYLLRRIQHATIAKAGIQKELGLASSIQMGMIPRIYPALPTRHEVDLCGFLKPAKSVGGDLYDYFVQDDNLYFCIGDVSGKGVPASLLMMVIISLFRNVARNFTDPQSIVESINQSIARNNSQMMFCTMIVGILHLPTGHLKYCNAGHNAPVLCKVKGDDCDVAYMPAGENMPVGVFEDAQFQGGELHLHPGDALFLYTDGVNEAQNARQEQFGEEAVVEALQEEMARQSTSDVVVGAIYDHLARHACGTEQSDDITMLHLRYVGTPL